MFRVLFSSACLVAIGCTSWQQPLMSGFPTYGHRFEQQLSSARLVEQSGQLLQARQRYEKLLERFPHEPEVYQRLGVLCQLQGENARATQFLEQAHQRSPENGDILNDLGYSLYMQGNHKRAIAALQQAQEINPREPRVVANLAMALAAAGDVNAAYTLLRSTNGESKAATGIGFAMANAGQLEAAHEYFSRALDANPDNRAAAEGLLQLAQSGRSSDFPSAASALDRGRATNAHLLVRGTGFVAAPQTISGQTMFIPQTVVSAPERESSPVLAALVRTPSRLSIEAAVQGNEDYPTSTGVASAGVASLDGEAQKLSASAAFASLSHNAVTSTVSRPVAALPTPSQPQAHIEELRTLNEPATEQALPQLRPDALAISAESRGLQRMDLRTATAFTTATALDIEDPKLSKAAPMLTPVGETTTSTAIQVSSQRLSSRETHEQLEGDVWQSTDSLWKPAPVNSDWISAGDGVAVRSENSRTPRAMPLSAPSLLPQLPFAMHGNSATSGTTPLPIARPTPRFDEQPAVSTPIEKSSKQETASAENRPLPAADVEWESQLISDYEALPPRKRLELWRHPNLDSRKVLCLFPGTAGVERVEATLAVARLLGWHDFARISLRELMTSDDASVREYAQRALEKRLAQEESPLPDSADQ